MVLMVWAAQGSFVLLQIVAVAGVGWWLLALLWLRFYDFASDHDTHARAFKLAAGTLATLAAWCALVLIHGDQPVQADPPMGHRRSAEHTSELQSLMRISYAVFCLKKKKTTYN